GAKHAKWYLSLFTTQHLNIPFAHSAYSAVLLYRQGREARQVVFVSFHYPTPQYSLCALRVLRGFNPV
ncbi:MAG: hypothetical protein ACNA78_10615, partial [Balneolaceae bacterium]